LTEEGFFIKGYTGLKDTTGCLSNDDRDVQLSNMDSWAFFCQK
jgi:hypothetical protein